MISQSSIVVAVQEHLSADLGGEAALLDMRNGIYYGLDTVGSRIWTLIQDPKTVEQVRATLMQEYDVDSSRCTQDVVAFLQVLLDRGLVEVRGEYP